jgi:hypothetical protein
MLAEGEEAKNWWQWITPALAVACGRHLNESKDIVTQF